MNLSKRINEMQASPIRKLVPLAIEAKARGIKVYHLNIGQPDIKTPQVFFDAIKNHKDKVVGYALSPGDPNLIQAIRRFFERDGIHFDSDEIVITNGGSEAIMFAMQAICDPGDEVLIPEPFYTNYNSFLKETGVKIVPITTMATNGFHLPSSNEIESLITPKTKAILFSNPGNPTGTVLTWDELERLKEVALKYDLFLISDEVYRKLVFDHEITHSLGSLKGIDNNAIIIESVSKRYSTCGARIGSIQSKNKELMHQVVKLAQARLSVSTLDQIGATALYDLDDSYIDSIRMEYEKRRDIVISELSQIPNIKFETPKGAFYIIITLPVNDAENFVKWMLTDFELNKETVMLAPAEDFYANKNLGKRQVRIAYVLESTQLKKAMIVFKEGIQKYIQKRKND
ncbi:MAG: pyridoxal phosphate-dependent aminotransferase [Candidatus Izemoplasmatales bacterium]|nr:pyridoxal phosphate-dependent aminotransferase [Candidatus Izemoplasmatales bacterium]